MNNVFGVKKADGLYYDNNGRNVTPSYHGAECYSSETVYYYEVGATDGSYRKCATKEEALRRFEQLVDFQKRQTEIR